MKFWILLVLLSLATAAYRPAAAEIKIIPFHSNQSGVELSPDGKTIATHELGVIQGDEIYPDLLPIRLFDAETGTEKALLIGHTDYAIDIAFSPDSQTLASYHFPGYVYLWDVETATLLKQIPTLMWGGMITFLSDNKTVALMFNNSYSPTFLLLDTETEVVTNILIDRYESRKDFLEYTDRVRPPDMISAFTVAPDEQSVMVMMASGNLFRWQISPQQTESVYVVDETLPMFNTRKIMFSSDGNMIVYEQHDEQVVYVLDAANGAEKSVIPASGIAAFDLASDGDTLAWLDREVATLNVTSLSQPDAEPTVIQLPLPEGFRMVGPTVTVEFLPDDQRVMVGGFAQASEPENALLIVTVR